MDEADDWINKWIEFSGDAREKLSLLQRRSIEPLEFRQAVCELLGVGNSLDLIYRELPTVEEIVEQLKAFPFDGPVGEVVETVVLESSILPEGMLRLLEEETIKQGGEQWRIHRYDADPHPSNPHAHNLSSGLKLHLGTGRLYKKREIVDRISCKDLVKLRERITKTELPPYECD